MKTIGFIGAFDKIDLLLYVSKVLVELNKKVLVIDTTITQKTRYIIPAMSPSKQYVSDYLGIDVATGFESLEDIKKYLGTAELEYDFVLMDVDSNKIFEEFGLRRADRNYFVTAFDNYSLKKGLEIVGSGPEIVTMTKVLFSRDMLEEENDYLDFLALYYSIQWTNYKIYFPFDHGDASVIMENQRAAYISFKNLTVEYKEGLLLILEQIVDDKRPNEIRKVFRNI